MTVEDRKFPLCWPDNWQRTNPAYRNVSRFGLRSIAAAFNCLSDEMRRLGCDDWLMSSNIPRSTRDGGPLSNIKSRLSDPGVAIYFKIKGRPCALACDKWLDVEDNIYAIAKHIEALRGQQRWGVGSVEKAFGGYMALPGIGQSGGMKWWEISGVPVNAGEEQIRGAYRLLAKAHHPDVNNGDREKWEPIRQAYELAEGMFKKS